MIDAFGHCTSNSYEILDKLFECRRPARPTSPPDPIACLTDRLTPTTVPLACPTRPPGSLARAHVAYTVI